MTPPLRSRALSRNLSPTTANVSACFFDLLALGSEDLRPLRLIDRKHQLRELLRGADQRLVYVDHVEERGEELLAGARALRLEGVVAKRSDSRYIAGRTGDWRKVKVEETADFVVVGLAEPSEGTFWRPGLVLATCTDQGTLRYVGRVAVGGAELDALEPVVAQLQRPTSPCPRAGRATIWLEPALVVEVRFLASSRRALRHPVFVRFRPDKPWRECAGRF